MNKYQIDTRKERTGAIGFADILGFKGIADRYNTEAILGRLERIRESAQQELDSQLKLIPEVVSAVVFDLGLSFISDTVSVFCSCEPATSGQSSCFCPPEPGDTDGEHRLADLVTEVMQHDFFPYQAFALRCVCSVLSKACGGGISGSLNNPAHPVFNYRGAISWGKFVAHEGFLFGPAVDEAAELHERANGAFVFLTGSAKEHYERWRSFSCRWPEETDRTFREAEKSPDLLLQIGCLTESIVPLKCGGSRNTYSVNPFAYAMRHEWKQISETFLNQMTCKQSDPKSLRDSVNEKRKYTSEFHAYLLENGSCMLDHEWQLPP